jgi:hypothetical protein
MLQDQPRVCQPVSLMFLSIGDVGTDYQGGALPSIVVRIQGAVRTMGFDPDGPVVQVEGCFVTSGHMRLATSEHRLRFRGYLA